MGNACLNRTDRLMFYYIMLAEKCQTSKKVFNYTARRQIGRNNAKYCLVQNSKNVVLGLTRISKIRRIRHPLKSNWDLARIDANSMKMCISMKLVIYCMSQQ